MTFKRIRMAISQPRIRTAPSEYDMSVDELETWGRTTARSAVASCTAAVQFAPNVTPEEWNSTFLRPAEKACKFCKVKVTCAALRNELTATTIGQTAAEPDEFVDLTAPKVIDATDQDWLEAVVSKADMFEDLLKSARAELERRLLAGVPSKQFKLVQGKRGARQWADEKEAETMLKSFRLKQEEMYSFKLISPTTAEKLAKAETIGKRQWPKLQELITQKDGAPHVAPVTDSRPALTVTPVVDDFTDVTVEALA